MNWSWTQPCCITCWCSVENDDISVRIPFRSPNRRIEVCVHCNHTTQSGIYIRVDPKEAKFPSIKDG